MEVSHIRGPGLDRREELRGEAGVLDERAGVVVVRGHHALVRDDEAVVLDLAAIEDPGALVFLGEHDGRRYAGWAVTEHEASSLEAATGGTMTSLRWAGTRLPPWQAGLLFYAAGLLAWHERTRHCGVCGAPTRVRRSGHQRVCTAGGCGQVHFPRADPAIITLVRRGERALLVRQPRWPEGRFSTLAGFVEPGESLEQAVVREVAEEVGLDVAAVDYFASQPWPFPHTLMVGFRTEAAGGEVVLGDELVDARWYTRDELRAALAAGEITIPEPYALSRSLIEDWLGA
ncbi:MAG: NAD(+) diphosphatase [Longimicrobiales bacterium]|nr:NAD(+) diphosphatase [Longimicrobiales bacterium]